MMNQEFQELKMQLKTNNGNNDLIITKMKENLLKRNNNNAQYTFRNTGLPIQWNINKCTKEQLIAINNDIDSQNQ